LAGLLQSIDIIQSGITFLDHTVCYFVKQCKSDVRYARF